MTNEDGIPAPATRANIVMSSGQFVPTTFDEAWRMAQVYAASDLVPKDYRGKPANVIVAIQKGAELGLKPLQALDGIAVINGRAGVWGDLLWALVRGSRAIAQIGETFDEASWTAVCTIKRKDGEVIVGKFTKADAEKAGLWNKEGPWRSYPKRMLQMRARAFAARDAVPEALKGLAVLDEFVGMDPEPAPQVNKEAATSSEPRGAVEKLRAAVLPAPSVPDVVEARSAAAVAVNAGAEPAPSDVPEGDPRNLTGREVE